MLVISKVVWWICKDLSYSSLNFLKCLKSFIIKGFQNKSAPENPRNVESLSPWANEPFAIRPHGPIMVYAEMSLNQEKFRVFQCPLETKMEK